MIAARLRCVPARTFLAVAGSVVALAALPACGGEETDEALLEALSYLEADAALVVVASTELEDSDLAELDELGSRLAGWEGLRSAVRDAATVGGGSFEEDLEPQLGDPLVFSPGVRGTGQRAALRLQSPNEQRSSVEAAIQDGEVEGLRGYEGALVWRDDAAPLAFGAVHEDTLVLSESEEQLRAAIDSSSASDNLSTDDALVSRLEHPGEDPPLRFAADAQRPLRSLPAGERARELTWIRALDIASGSISVDGEAIVASVEIESDRREVTPEGLPLAEGSAAPHLPDPGDGVAVGLRAPAHTAAFVLGLLEVLGADEGGGVLDAVETVRTSLDLDPVGDVLGRVDELWVAVDIERGVAFRARLDDPEGLDAELRRAPMFVTTLLESLGVQDAVLEINGDSFAVVSDAEELARFELDGNELRGTLEPFLREDFEDMPPGADQGSLRALADPGFLEPLAPDGRLGTSIVRLLDQAGPLSVEVETRPTRTRARVTLPLTP